MNINDFNSLFKSVEKKGLISPNGYKKLKFIYYNNVYYVKYTDTNIRNYIEQEFQELDPVPEILINKFMWTERKKTVDGIILNDENRIFLIKRKYAPLGYAMPGGMIDPGEVPFQSFVREMKEELTLDIKDYSFFIEHDADEPRGPIKTFVYITNIKENPVPADDALEGEFVSVQSLNQIDWAFEHHHEILMKFVQSVNLNSHSEKK